MAAIPQNLGVPTGTVLWSAAPEVPVGWLLCDGRFVTTESYPALYEYIGNSFGGDNVTFGLPNLVGRFIVGVGDAGRAPFTYEDGINKEHLHGMFPNQTHTHGVTDPGHEHPTSSGTHSHVTTSNHSHTNTSNHFHRFNFGSFITHSYTSKTNSAPEAYSEPGQQYPRNPDTDFWLTLKTSFTQAPYNPEGKTGITQVNANVTGTSVQIAFTGVTLQNQFTGITLNPSLSNISVDPVGVVGGPRPRNIAFLPIIRT